MHSFESLLTRAESVFGGRCVVSFCGRIPGDPVSYDICHEEDYVTFLTRYSLRLAHDDNSTRTLTLPCLCARLAPEEPELDISAVTEPTPLLGNVPIVPSVVDTDEIAEVQPSAEDDAQPQDLLHTRIDEDDQRSDDHPSPPDDPDGNQETMKMAGLMAEYHQQPLARTGDIRGSGQQRSTVVVTTFNVLSAGRNDLVFANIVIKLGEPWTNALTEQAIGRVDRPGQGQPTIFFDLFRKDNEAEALVRARNRHRKGILGEKLSDNRLFGIIDTNPSS
ncbi:hypothetical protein LRP88_14911 [Fusarium phalaenopsidis]